MRCGVPVMIFATSPCALSQKEQRNPLAFILAITGVLQTSEISDLRLGSDTALLAVRDHLID